MQEWELTGRMLMCKLHTTERSSGRSLSPSKLDHLADPLDGALTSASVVKVHAPEDASSKGTKKYIFH